VEFIGEVDEREKNTFLGNAKTLLFPIERQTTIVLEIRVPKGEQVKGKRIGVKAV